MRMYEVFYDGKKIGLVRSNGNNIYDNSFNLIMSQTKHETNLLFGQQIERSKISFSDENHEKYRHMM